MTPRAAPAKPNATHVNGVCSHTFEEEKGCDLIMMASHGRRGVKGLLLGSETQKVLTHSRIPVLVYR